MLRCASEVKTQRKPLSSQLERRQNIENHNLPSEKMAWETVLEQENWNCDRGISGGSVRTTVIDKNFIRVQSWRSPHFYKFYLQELFQVLTVILRRGRGMLSCLHQGEGKGIILIFARAFCSFTRV